MKGFFFDHFPYKTGSYVQLSSTRISNIDFTEKSEQVKSGENRWMVESPTIWFSHALCIVFFWRLWRFGVDRPINRQADQSFQVHERHDFSLHDWQPPKVCHFFPLTPLKTNGWNLKIPPKGKGGNIDPKHQFLGSMFVLGGVTFITFGLLY